MASTGQAGKLVAAMTSPHAVRAAQASDEWRMGMSCGSNGKAVPAVRLTLRDEPPEIASGTLVEIEVVERSGPAAVYADLLAVATTGDVETIFAARCLRPRPVCGAVGTRLTRTSSSI